MKENHELDIASKLQNQNLEIVVNIDESDGKMTNQPCYNTYPTVKLRDYLRASKSQASRLLKP
jgi:hypothetical protein